MRRLLTSLAGVVLLVGAIWLPVGCSFGGAGFDFIKMMTCPNDPIESQGDLIFANLQFTLGSINPAPGDIANFTFTVLNAAPQGTPNANIGMPSNMKVFLSFNNRIGPASYLFGDIPTSGINAGDSYSDMTTLRLPRASAEPDTTDIPIGTGNLNDDQLTTNQNTDGILGENDWVIVRGPAPNFNEAYVRITEVITAGSVYEIEGQHPDGPTVNNAELFKTDRPKYFPYLIPDVSPEGGVEGIRDPNSPNYIGPQMITYNVIVVIDAQNCIIEAGEPTTPEYERYDETDPMDGAGLFPGTYNPGDPRLNNQAIADTITVLNPNLPNLQISYLDRSPTTDIPQTGGVINTRWEITNDGISPVTTPFLTRIYFSENESHSPWDPKVQESNWPEFDPDGSGNMQPVPIPHGLLDASPALHPWVHASYEVNTTVPGGSNVFEIIRINFPYYTWRTNNYAQADESALFQWVEGNPAMFVRRAPPMGPPDAWWFAVYLPIPSIGGSSNFLIAEVDVKDLWYGYFIGEYATLADFPDYPFWPDFPAWPPDPFGGVLPPNDLHSDRVRESNEWDNFSHLIQNGNGNIEVGFTNDLFPLDAAAVDLTVTATQQQTGFWFDLRYDNELPGEQFSIGFYLSLDDTFQSADWYWNRFWWLLQTGQGLSESNFYANIMDVPTTGNWFVGATIDDIFRYGFRNNDNNGTMTNGSITIQ